MDQKPPPESFDELKNLIVGDVFRWIHQLPNYKKTIVMIVSFFLLLVVARLGLLGEVPLKYAKFVIPATIALVDGPYELIPLSFTYEIESDQATRKGRDNDTFYSNERLNFKLKSGSRSWIAAFVVDSDRIFPLFTGSLSAFLVEKNQPYSYYNKVNFSSDYIAAYVIASPTKFDIEDLLDLEPIVKLTSKTNNSGTTDIQLPENFAYKSIHLKRSDFAYENNDVAMDVTVLGKDTELGKLYGMTITEDGYKFYPESPYLDALSKGGPLNIDGANLWWDLSEIDFPSLDIKVTNNSDKTINFTKTIFEIEESIEDTRALPYIKQVACSEALIEIRNEGWGAMENAEMHFNIISVLDNSFAEEIVTARGRVGTPVGVIRVNDPNIFEGPYKFVKKLGTIEKHTKVNLSDELSQLGLTEKVKQMIMNSAIESRDEAVKKIPFFQMISKNTLNNEDYNSDNYYDARIYGKLKYMQHLNGNKVPASVDFQTQFAIVDFGCGGGGPITAQYEGLVFDLNNKNYRRIVPISQNIKKGETDRFTIRMTAKKSSTHRFKFRLSFGKDDELVSPNISLYIYAPRSFVVGDNKD